MNVTAGELDGVYHIDLDPNVDERGFFMRVYDQDVFNKHGIDRTWVQDSHSSSTQRGILRGLHFQFPPRAETKLIRVIEGSIYDVYLDVRAGSPTFGEWRSIELSAEDRKMLLVPRGFAHGFCTLTDEVEIIYRIDNYYDPDLASAIRWDSPDLGIPWPVDDPVLSERDSNANTFSDFVEEFGGVEL